MIVALSYNKDKKSKPTSPKCFKQKQQNIWKLTIIKWNGNIAKLLIWSTVTLKIPKRTIMSAEIVWIIRLPYFDLFYNGKISKKEIKIIISSKYFERMLLFSYFLVWQSKIENSNSIGLIFVLFLLSFWLGNKAIRA